MNVVCIGAHPDDCEVFAGGTAVKWARRGDRVLFVSLTNGDIGHHEIYGERLAERRRAEARLSARRGGVEEMVLDWPDGELQPTLDLRKEVVRIIRRRQADVVLTHRANDYHPDHRYTSIVVQDAAFMVTVPGFCPDVPRLPTNPAFLYLADPFKKPVAFHPDIAVDVDDVMDVKWSMLDSMGSQFYEWLPWLDGAAHKAPKDPNARRLWLEKTWSPFFRAFTARAKNALKAWYGAEAARRVRFAEVFEICEYGRRPSKAELRRLMPFRAEETKGE